VGDTGSPQKLAALMDNFFSDEHRFVAWKTQVSAVRQLICWEKKEKNLVEIYEALR